MPYRDAEPVSVSKNRFSTAMARCGDVELIAMVEGPAEDWEPEALAAAHTEIARRALPFEVREELVREVEEIGTKARSPLERTTRWMAFGGGAVGLLPGLIVLFLYTRYQRRGFPRRAKDLFHWYASGLVVHVLAVVVLALRH